MLARSRGPTWFSTTASGSVGLCRGCAAAAAAALLLPAPAAGWVLRLMMLLVGLRMGRVVISSGAGAAMAAAEACTKQLPSLQGHRQAWRRSDWQGCWRGADLAAHGRGPSGGSCAVLCRALAHLNSLGSIGLSISAAKDPISIIRPGSSWEGTLILDLLIALPSCGGTARAA